jgi:uncharacterized protein
MNVLIIFIKNARLGYVKTRLAATVGNEKALEIYQQLLAKTRAAALDSTAECSLWYSDTLVENDEWDSAFFNKKVQPAGDLGQRMSAAFRQEMEGGASKAVIIGSDCPDVNGAVIDQALQLLDHNDVVVGPTFDGGYYLLGMNRYLPDLFENVAWSTPEVLETTREKCITQGYSLALLPLLNDIDDEGDWDEYRNR